MPRPLTVTLAAAGFSPWMGANWRAMNGVFAIGLGVKLSSGASLTYSIQHTFDEIYTPTKLWSAARVGTTATVTKVGHKLSVNDWIRIDPPALPPFVGEFPVASIVDADNFTFTVANSGATAVIFGSADIHTARVFEHQTVTGFTASAFDNYAFPPRAFRLAVTTYASGSAELTAIQAG